MSEEQNREEEQTQPDPQQETAAEDSSQPDATDETSVEEVASGPPVFSVGGEPTAVTEKPEEEETDAVLEIPMRKLNSAGNRTTVPAVEESAKESQKGKGKGGSNKRRQLTHMSDDEVNTLTYLLLSKLPCDDLSGTKKHKKTTDVLPGTKKQKRQLAKEVCADYGKEGDEGRLLAYVETRVRSVPAGSAREKIDFVLGQLERDGIAARVGALRQESSNNSVLWICLSILCGAALIAGAILIAL